MRKIGDNGTGKEIMDEPISVAFTSSGDILVVQLSSPSKKQLSVFTERGHYITDISKHVLRQHSVSVRKDGNLLMCDVLRFFLLMTQNSYRPLKLRTVMRALGLLFLTKACFLFLMTHYIM